jgi:hypothetical protein
LPHLVEEIDENSNSQIYQNDGASSHDCEEVIGLYYQIKE